MGLKSAIGWTDATWNPWQGCKKVSLGCRHCYMYREKTFYGQDPSTVKRSAPATFNLPLAKTRDKSYKLPAGTRVFTCSWSDWCIAEADEWRAEAWAMVRERKDLSFLILTKRLDRLPLCLPEDWGDGYENTWLGCSAENQQLLEERARKLLAVKSRHYFVSLEPQLEEITVSHFLRKEPAAPGFDWVIGGGESGDLTTRGYDLAWARRLIRECAAAGIPYFQKQLGTIAAQALNIKPPGNEIERFPVDLRVQQFPSALTPAVVAGVANNHGE